MLLAAEGFATWRTANPARERLLDEAPQVALEVRDGGIEVRLTRSTARNAFDARMRDALCEAFVFALDHPDIPPVILNGEGPAFSAGGDLDEFGRASDPGAAHLIRGLRAPAALARRLGRSGPYQLPFRGVWRGSANADRRALLPHPADGVTYLRAFCTEVVE